MPSPRVDFAAAIADAGPAELSVFAEEPQTPPALPAVILTPGNPYRRTSEGPRCVETWRLRVLALVPIDAVGPLDTLDGLADLVRDVIAATPNARYLGVIEAASARSVAGKDMRSAIVDVELTA
jgi:hypothetical protein